MGSEMSRFRLLTAALAGDLARVDDLIVLSENAADRGGMDLEQAGRPRTRSLALVTLRHLSSYCAQLSSWAARWHWSLFAICLRIALS
ncbi:hypothetical protein X737_29145 [Mesorhizobium sp. L48C026A00]|nr:hypothetical protein X737_29145 [Mesorhizobium sp. L48C026A00]